MHSLRRAPHVAAAVSRQLTRWAVWDLRLAPPALPPALPTARVRLSSQSAEVDSAVHDAAALSAAISSGSVEASLVSFRVAEKSGVGISLSSLLSLLALWAPAAGTGNAAAASALHSAWAALLATPDLGGSAGLQAQLTGALLPAARAGALVALLPALRSSGATSGTGAAAGRALLDAAAEAGDFRALREVLDTLAALRVAPTGAAAAAWMQWLSRAGRHAEALVEERVRKLAPPLRGALHAGPRALATPDPDDAAAVARAEGGALAPAYARLRPRRAPAAADPTALLASRQQRAGSEYGRAPTLPALADAGLEVSAPAVGDCVTDVAALHTALFGQLPAGAAGDALALRAACWPHSALGGAPHTVSGVPHEPAQWPRLALAWLQDARAAAAAGGSAARPPLSTWHYGAVIRAAAAVAAAGHAAPPLWALVPAAPLAACATGRPGALALDAHVAVAEAALGALLADGAPLDERLLLPLAHLYSAPHLQLPHLAPLEEDGQPDGSWHWGLRRARLLFRQLLAPPPEAPAETPAVRAWLRALLQEDFAEAPGALQPQPLDERLQPPFPFAPPPPAAQLRGPPPPALFPALLGAASDAGSAHFAFGSLHDLLLEQGCLPDADGLLALVSAAVHGGALPAAVALLEGVAAAALPLPREAAEVALAAAVRADAPEAAHRVLGALERAGVAPGAATLALLRDADVIGAEHPGLEGAATEHWEALQEARSSALSVYGRDVYDLVAEVAARDQLSDSDGESSSEDSDADSGLMPPAQVMRGLMSVQGAPERQSRPPPPAAPRRRRSVFGADAPAVPPPVDDDEEEDEEEAVVWGAGAGALLQEIDEGALLRVAVRAEEEEEEEVPEAAPSRRRRPARGQGAAAREAAALAALAPPQPPPDEAPEEGGRQPTAHIPVAPAGASLSASQRKLREAALPRVTREQDAEFDAGVGALVSSGVLPEHGLVSRGGHFVIPLHAGVAMTGPQKPWLRYVHDEGPLLGLAGPALVEATARKGRVHSRHLAAWLRNRGLAPANLATGGKRAALAALVAQHADAAAELAQAHGTAPYLPADVRAAVVEAVGHLPHLEMGLRRRGDGSALGGALAFSRRLGGDKRGGAQAQRRRQRAGLLGDATPVAAPAAPAAPAPVGLSSAEADQLSEDFDAFLPEGLVFVAERVWSAGSRRARADEGPLGGLDPVDVKLELDLRPGMKARHLRAWLGNRGFTAPGSASRGTLYMMVKEVAMRDALMAAHKEP
ncbi:hypothetical protein BU14_1378s0002 [Porphyra umbilicalis]|uniref:Uncharacterized protein n=1 Tax=Porphyra umbilicalis TaxID=2786 RepID=A0A1X6NM07_PORUM|nr:hypothetical protein BU14_1378s0002 [Porphyra umbilicalis]|eukprot:OSX69580.1 hypothetical protein BU14_1378s0002 [Porphyra umbilicalis]